MSKESDTNQRQRDLSERLEKLAQSLFTPPAPQSLAPPVLKSPSPVTLLDAVRKGDTDAVRRLLEQGGDPNACDKSMHSALAEACLHGFPQIAEFLVATGATVGIVEAAYLNDIPRLTRFLDEGVGIETENAAGVTPLRAACFCGHREVARFLLERGANPNAESQKGLSPLSAAVAWERIPLVHLLVDYGAEVNALSSRFDSTALHLAASFGKAASVAVLLARGADPNVVDGHKSTPLHKCTFAASMPLGKPDSWTRTATLLLDAGADIEARDNRGKTPLMKAAASGDPNLVRLLLERGADVRASRRGRFKTDVLYHPRVPGDNHEKIEARSLIMQALGPEYAVYDAAERGDVDDLTALLDAGAPADQGIVFNPALLSDGPFTAEDIAEKPLSAAASKGRFDVVRLLLARGVSQRSKDTALFAAEWEGYDAVADLLRAAGAVNEQAAKTRGRRKVITI